MQLHLFDSPVWPLQLPLADGPGYAVSAPRSRSYRDRPLLPTYRNRSGRIGYTVFGARPNVTYFYRVREDSPS